MKYLYVVNDTLIYEGVGKTVSILFSKFKAKMPFMDHKYVKSVLTYLFAFNTFIVTVCFLLILEKYLLQIIILWCCKKFLIDSGETNIRGNNGKS